MSGICRHCRNRILRCEGRNKFLHDPHFRCRGWCHRNGWHACTSQSKGVVTAHGTYAEPDPFVAKIKEALLV